MSEARRAKAHKLLRNNDPQINPMDYDTSMMRFVNYLNTTYDAKQRMTWIKDRFPKVKFKDAPDLEYRTLSSLIRAQDNGNVLSEKHEALITSEVDRLTDKSKIKKVVTVVEAEPVKKPSIQDKMDEKVSEFLGEFAGLVDQYVTDRTIPKVEPLVNQMGIRGPMIKKILEKIAKPMEELQEVLEGSDKQLVEGYSNFKKPELKKLLGIYETLVTVLGQAKVMVVRKPRKTKVKPPAVIAKSVKYMPEFPELGLKSIPPAHVVGMTEVWGYNTKYRKLFVLKAIDGQTLTFKGTTVLNFNVETSLMKAMRKPETLKEVIGQGTRSYNKFFKENKSKPAKHTGRINSDIVLLAAFK